MERQMNTTRITYDSIEVASWYGQFCDYAPVVIIDGANGRERCRVPGQYRSHAAAVRAARKDVREHPESYR